VCKGHNGCATGCRSGPWMPNWEACARAKALADITKPPWSALSSPMRLLDAREFISKQASMHHHAELGHQWKGSLMFRVLVHGH
jgi:hypothetical protein